MEPSPASCVDREVAALPARKEPRVDPVDREGLVSAYGPMVWSLCRRLGPDPEDAYQEVWEKVFGAVDRFDPAGPATLRTWIATVTHRHLVDRHRRRQVRGEVVELGDVPVAAE